MGAPVMNGAQAAQSDEAAGVSVDMKRPMLKQVWRARAAASPALRCCLHGAADTHRRRGMRGDRSAATLTPLPPGSSLLPHASCAAGVARRSR